jgi:hypothetical protein
MQVWSASSEELSCIVHVTLDEEAAPEDVRRDVAVALHEQHGFAA